MLVEDRILVVPMNRHCNDYSIQCHSNGTTALGEAGVGFVFTAELRRKQHCFRCFPENGTQIIGDLRSTVELWCSRAIKDILYTLFSGSSGTDADLIIRSGSK